MCETGHSNLTFTTVEQKIEWEYLEAKIAVGIPWGIPNHWDTVILLKTAYFKHFEHFPAIEIFEIIKFTVWNWSKPDFHCCMGIPWYVWNWSFWQWICVKLVTVTWLSPLLSKKLHGNTLRHTWDTVILLKTAYFQHSIFSYWNFGNNFTANHFKHFEHFPAIEIFEIIKFTVNHREYVWNWSQ